MIYLTEIWNNTLYHVSQYEVVYADSEESAIEYTFNLWLKLLPGHELFVRVVPPNQWKNLPDWFDQKGLFTDVSDSLQPITQT